MNSQTVNKTNMDMKGTVASTLVYQELEPSTEWVTEDDCNTLLLYLPGFAKEQLRVQLRSRTLIIRGERRLHENTWSRFQKEFIVSEHCDVNRISAKFEGSILFVKQPKFITPVAKQEEYSSTKASAPMPGNPMDEPDTKPTSTTQPNGKNGVHQNKKNIEEKDGNSTGKVSEKKEPKGVCENASKKKTFVTNMKPSKNALNRILVLVIGFVVGVYCSDLIRSWMA